MTLTSLKEIVKPIERELIAFEDYFRNYLKTSIPLLNLVISYILKRKGKRIRPALIFLCADLVGAITPRTYVGAIMVELLHTATLLHDDVVDQASERRGFPSVNFKWSNKVAILAGDYFLAKGLLISIENNEFEFLRVLSESVRLMSEGELLQIQKSKEEETSEETYFEIIYGKTASLISACCEIGAISAGADEVTRKKLREFGKLLGLAFQIKDDIFDYVGKSSIIGKPVGNDIREKKITLPLIYALENVSPNQAEKIIKQVKSKNNKKDVNYIIDFVVANNGIEKAEQKASDFISQAKGILIEFEPSEAREMLLKLSDFIVQRNK